MIVESSLKIGSGDPFLFSGSYWNEGIHFIPIQIEYNFYVRTQAFFFKNFDTGYNKIPMFNNANIQNEYR